MVQVLPFVLAALAIVTTHSDPAGRSNKTRPTVRRDAETLLHAMDRPVRATSAEVQRLLERGMARSRTFSELVSALDISDVIVYVEINRKLPSAIAGRMLFATASQDGPRYLRVQIAHEPNANRQVAAIGHELRHALEVAEAIEVRDEQGLARFYERVGTPGPMSHSYDTSAAQVTGQRVLLELLGMG